MERHWLVRPGTVRVLWILFAAVLAATVLAQLAVHVDGHFGIDATLGFNAWYGFATCAAMIVAAKALGWLLKRRDNYYEARAEDEG